MNKVIAIIGPTGIGKSRLAVHLAQVFPGEIISADSRQIYRYLDIGTAKPSMEELALVPHYFISIINPDEDFSVAQYQELAYQTIDDIQQRELNPFFVGGSGLYVWSVLEGWGMPRIKPDPEFRTSMERLAETHGREMLYEQLQREDPLAAQRVDPNNVRRVIRALEVSRSDNGPAKLPSRQDPPYDVLLIGLTTERNLLYKIIDQRVDRMIEQGLVEEVEHLNQIGYQFRLPAMSSIGYRQIGEYMRGDISLATAIQQMKFETHRYVRQQYNWFKLKDERIHWYDIRQDDTVDKIENLVESFLKQQNP